MKKRASRMESFLTIGLIFLVSFGLNKVSMADGVTSTLTIIPTPCKRGDVLKFSATVYNNPLLSTQPGTAYFCSVVLDNTNSPELNSWSTEFQTFKYPGPGKTVTVNFTSTYTVPDHLKGEMVCFYVVGGKEKPNKISSKTCIKVVAPIMRQKTMK